MRYCADIGLSAIDRPKTSCKWATPFCKKTCYNVKTYKRFPDAVYIESSRSDNAIRRIRAALRGVEVCAGCGEAITGHYEYGEDSKGNNWELCEGCAKGERGKR